MTGKHEMIITTARQKNHLEQRALKIAHDLNVPYAKRADFSLAQVAAQYNVTEVLLLNNDGLKCVFIDDPRHPFFFHPNSAMFRLRRLRKGENDIMVDAARLSAGMSFLDCTLGLASDAIVASYVCGPNGKVTGIEAQQTMAYIVRDGLQNWRTEHETFDESMRRVEVYAMDHLSFLQDCPSEAYDVVYFDPMFEKSINTSAGLAPLKRLAKYSEISEESLIQAKRIAKRRVLMKDSPYSERFKRFGLQPLLRKYANHWFATFER